MSLSHLSQPQPFFIFWLVLVGSDLVMAVVDLAYLAKYGWLMTGWGGGSWRLVHICECMNAEFWWCQSRIKQGCFNKHSKVKHCFKINSRSSKQDQEKDKASNNLTGWLVFALKQIVSKRSKTLVIDYQTV